MPNLKEFLTRLASDAGIEITQDQLAQTLASPDLEKINIDTSLENVFRSKLMNVNSAKNNPDLNSFFKSKYTNEALSGVDSVMLKIAEDLGFDETGLKEMKDQEKTLSKLTVLKDKLKESYEKKGSNSTQSAKIEEERKTLNDKIKTLESSFTKMNSDWESKYNKELSDFTLNTVLQGYRYGLPKEVPQEAVLDTARNLITRKLDERKMKVQYNPEYKKLELLTEAGTKAYENNVELSFKDFSDKVLADAKLLEVSGAPVQPQTQNSNNNSQQSSANDFSDFYTRQLAELNKD